MDIASVYVELRLNDGRKIRLEIVSEPTRPIKGHLTLDMEPVEDVEAFGSWRAYQPGPRTVDLKLTGPLGTTVTSP